MERIMTVKDLAEHLQVSTAYIRKLLEDGEIPHFMLPGKIRGTRFRESEIAEWMDGISKGQRIDDGEDYDPEAGI